MAFEKVEWGISWAEFLAELAMSADRRDALTRTIVDCPYEAVFWETNPVSIESLDQPFEFVLVDAPALAQVAPQPDAFREHFDSPDADLWVTSFENLGRDAALVVPMPVADPGVYPHLARFVRKAPPEQVDATWQAVATAMQERLAQSEGRIWLSTSGLGVYWVHIRLDTRPKYYTHRPYRE